MTDRKITPATDEEMIRNIRENVSPYTDADVSKILVNQSLLPHASPLTLACMVLSGIARIEADRARIDELKAQVRERDEEIARLKERMSTLYRIEPLDVSKLIDQAVADEKARGGAR